MSRIRVRHPHQGETETRGERERETRGGRGSVPVNGLAILLSLNHLWCHVRDRSTPGRGRVITVYIFLRVRQGVECW